MSSRTLYHVTITSVVAAILDKGIDPDMSQGRQCVSWFVSAKNLTWAIYHVQKRHRANLGDITVITAKVSERQLIKTNRRGVWACRKIQKPILTIPADMMLEDDAERTLHVPKH